jgi:diguanylate cyclase (GGDEF)-like protein
MRSSPHSTEGNAVTGAYPLFLPPRLLIVSFPRLAPFIRSTAAVLFRQNRIRGVFAAAAALVLLLSPYRSDRALVVALAGLTAYVAFVGASTLWIVRRQRASIPLMSAHGIADVTLVFTVARALPMDVETGWVLLAAAIPLQVALFQFGVRPAALVLVATLFWQLAVMVLADSAPQALPVTALPALASYLLLALVSFLLHRRVELRLAALRSLFDEAREGDFRRAYDIENDPHADSVTAVGAAFNELRAELAPLVNADPATGCLNRRGFALHLERALIDARRRRGEIALLALDLDHFKQINDRFGHLVGDEVLYEVAAMITEAVSEEGVVARMGGEEFTVLLPWADAESAGAVAERIMSRLRGRQCRALPPDTTVTMSIGIAAERIIDGNIGSALRARADEALYAAKRSGRDRVLLWASGVRSHATPPTSMAVITRRSGERPRYPTPSGPGKPVPG